MKKVQAKEKRLRDMLIGLEMQLDLVETDLIAVESDLEYLHSLRDDLVLNLKVLKKDKIIAIVSEYKKSVEQLSMIEYNISIYKNMKITLSKKYHQIRKSFKFHTDEHLKVKKHLEEDKVILLFDPKKRRDK